MSQGGLFSKLKNKVAFKVNQAVEDPEAQKYAEEQEKEKNKEAIPRVKSVEEIRREKMEEMTKEKGFSEKLNTLNNQIVESSIKKYVAEGKSEKEAQQQTVKYVFETLTPLLNKAVDENASSDKILSILQDELDQLTDTSDPNTISPKRIVKKFWRYLTLFIEKAFYPFLAIVLSMYVANEMIVYPAPIRTVFFVLTLIVCLLYSPVALGLGLFYLAKSGYSYYVNEMTAREKKRIMPTIFAMLPITTYQPEGGLESFFLYPFTYPKSKQDEEELPKIMKEYQDALDASFPYLEKIKGLPFVVEGLELIKKNLDTLHAPKEEEIKETAPSTLELNNETRKKFNELTSTQLPSTIESRPNKAVANQEVSPSAPVLVSNNKGQSNQEAPTAVNNKQINNQKVSSPINNKGTNNQTVAPPPFNNKGTANQVVVPPPIVNKESPNQSPPPFNNNASTKQEAPPLPPTINKEATNQGQPLVNNKETSTVTTLPPTIESPTSTEVNEASSSSLPPTISETKPTKVENVPPLPPTY